ncbi:hypothetical protein [Rhodococcus qingshengii]|uniref:hypothetical protein n=1 Tax=Rhodococcus qingshengii TaxID=334542 RepID=UPI0035E3315E
MPVKYIMAMDKMIRQTIQGSDKEVKREWFDRGDSFHCAVTISYLDGGYLLEDIMDFKVEK